MDTNQDPQENLEEAERILEEAGTANNAGLNMNGIETDNEKSVKEGTAQQNEIVPELPSTQQAAIMSLEQKRVSNPTRINKLVMHGFKSFAKHTEILLTGKFNCVLGPNGAGKSNVLDALCFVLGKSSSRELRAEKSANLIYNGGKDKQPAKKAEVSIYFDNSQKAFPTEDKEIKITRAVKPTGQSVYKINDEVRTRQQIIDLMSLARINPDGYNIILQGDIIRLVEMRPDERRQLVEEIAGISIYEEKKHKALLELEKVEGHLKETEIVLAERGAHLKELKKDRDQALKYKEMNDKIKQNKASYLKIQIDNNDNEKKDLSSKNEHGSKQLESVRKKIDDMKKDNEESRTKIKQIEKDIEEKGEIEQVKLNKEIESLKIEITKDHSRTETCRSETAKIKQRRLDLKANIEETEKKILELKNSVQEYGKITKSKEKERDSLYSRLMALKGKNQIENVAEIEQNVESLDKKADELQKEIQNLRELQHNTIRDKDKILNDVSMVDDRINKVVDVEKEYRKLMSELDEKRKEFKKSTLELNKCLEDDSAFAAYLGNLRRKIQTAQDELVKLRSRDLTIRETTRADAAVSKILELKGKKEGIYGTIAELGNVSSKYALALEVAAGLRIKSIVVESDRVASECIKYLKEKQLGTATFIPLNKINARETSEDAKKLAGAKGSHGIALDLITFESKFKRAFNYVFSDTVVVDTIDIALKLGVGKAKYVTLDGDVAETSGLMHGGFRTRRKQAAGFKEKELTNNIGKCESSIAQFQSEIDVHEKRRTQNETRITELREIKANLEGEIIKSEKSIGIETTDMAALNSRKKELNSQIENIDARLKETDSKLSELNRGLASLKIEKQKLRNKINELNNPTVLAEIYTFEQKLKEINDDLIRNTAEMENSEKQITAIFEPEKAKVEQILKHIEKDEQDFSSELLSLKNNIKEKESALKQKEDAAKEFYAKFKELFAESNSIKERMQKNEFAIEKLFDDSRQIEIKINTISLKMAETAAVLAGLNAEFQQYEGVKLDTEKTEQELKNEIAKFERMREDIGSVNMRALEIYDEVEKQYGEFVSKKDTLAKEKEEVVNLMGEIEGKKKELFMKTFTAIDENFKKFFSMLSTKGAQANLVLENEENPFEGGVRINVKITGSKFLDIRSLSGGEKTMTALAFIFAIQEHEPASFYILDEVDAALDKSNALRLAKMIKDYSSSAQYLIISHNDAVISEAEVLYGVSMNNDGVSQVVGLKV